MNDTDIERLGYLNINKLLFKAVIDQFAGTGSFGNDIVDIPASVLVRYVVIDVYDLF